MWLLEFQIWAHNNLSVIEAKSGLHWKLKTKKTKQIKSPLIFWRGHQKSSKSKMLHLFLGLKSLVKVSRYHTDGSVFRLHYRVTVTVLLAFTFIVTTRQYIASPIMCVHSREIPKDVLNTYCWIHPTYTLSSAHWKRVGIDVPHPGVDKTRDDRDKKHVKYYQWVGFCLFFQVRH